MTEAEWDNLREYEPELALPKWKEVQHAPFTLSRLTEAQLRAAVVSVRLVDNQDLRLYQRLVEEIFICVWGHT